MLLPGFLQAQTPTPCDLLIKNGKIIASGSFDELKEHSEDFQVLWERYIKTRDNF